ncbi:hypothetical protein RCO48_04080 [Peribacillus frigoritolerans]|nr:hypothetical protein [Peribacillus frigoritolerans]
MFVQLLRKSKRQKLSPAIKNDLLHKLSLKEEQLQNVSYVSSGLEVQAKAASKILTKGQNTYATITMKNNGKQTLKKSRCCIERA